MGLQSVPVEKIEMVQSRTNLDMMVIQEYAEAMSSGVHFPPISVLVDVDGKLWCWDGCHRTMAARQAGQAYIQADVSSGSRRDALLLAAGANSNHGLRRTNDDKRRAVQMLLDDPEWSAWSDREIARRCSVSNTFVSKLRPATVNVDSTAAEHTYTRAGQTQTMNTSNIGQRRGVGAWWTANDTNHVLQIREKENVPSPVSTGEGQGEGYFCLDCHLTPVDYPGQQCPDCVAAMNAREETRLELRAAAQRAAQELGARAVGSLALALKSDNCHAWHLMSGMTMPVFDSRDVDEMRRTLADKILIRAIGYQYADSENDVRKFFQQHNIGLQSSIDE